MTLANMLLYCRGVVLVAPAHPCLPSLPAGTHVQVIKKDNEYTVIDAEGVRIGMARALAARIIVIKQIT